VEGLKSKDAAKRFGYDPVGFRVLCWRFLHGGDTQFFQDVRHGPQAQPKKDAVRDQVVALRKKNYSVYDIRDELERLGDKRLGVTAIRELLRAEGFSRLPRRADEERPFQPRVVADEKADVRAFALQKGEFSTRVGGMFVLLPQIGRASCRERVS
jgi:hypothetical protein